MYRIFIFLLILSLTSCSIFSPSRMFRTGPNYQYKTEPPSYFSEYKISTNDVISFILYSNDGYKIVDISGSNLSGGVNVALEFNIDHEGNAKLPILGKIKLAGLTNPEAEKILEEKYSEFYKSPFVILKVLNKKILIYNGTNSAGSILTLTHENTSIIEAITKAGGISQSGRAKRIKLIRGDMYNPEIYLIDLSTIQSLGKASMILQPNDIIYIETAPRISQEILSQITPVISLLSSFFFIYDLTRKK